MSDVSDDIREKATAVARNWYHEEWEPEEHIQQVLVERIAEALMEERERCAKIADRLVMLPADECNIPFDSIVNAAMHGRRDCATNIAAAIRRGTA